MPWLLGEKSRETGETITSTHPSHASKDVG
jgi:hypothetical protein